MTQLLGDKLTEAAKRRLEYLESRRREGAAAVKKFADAGADLDIGIIRQKDRSRFGGILPPEIHREPSGWVPVTSLWECPPEAASGPLSHPGHVRYCTCEVWSNRISFADQVAR